MGTNSKEYVPHIESLRFVKKLERKLKHKARRVQSKTGLSYTDAAAIACGDFGVKNHYEFKSLCKKLRLRAEFLARHDDRIRCAKYEKPEPGRSYYIFSADLDFDEVDRHLGEVSLRPSVFRSLMTTWVGWADEEWDVELRVADCVDPTLALKKYRGLLRRSVYIINDECDLFLWMVTWGGIALIKEDLVAKQEFLAKWLTPFKCKTVSWE